MRDVIAWQGEQLLARQDQRLRKLRSMRGLELWRDAMLADGLERMREDGTLRLPDDANDATTERWLRSRCTRMGAEACKRVLRLLDARGFPYTSIPVESEADRAVLVERTGRMTCPLVFVGKHLLGGLQETVAAKRSGRLAALINA